MVDAIRVVEDNVEATEAWNGPLFEIWVKYRDLVAESVGEHGEAALVANPPARETVCSTSAVGSATRRCDSPASSAPQVTRTGWTSRSG